jgi:hypothetical protein
MSQIEIPQRSGAVLSFVRSTAVSLKMSFRPQKSQVLQGIIIGTRRAPMQCHPTSSSDLPPPPDLLGI